MLPAISRIPLHLQPQCREGGLGVYPNGGEGEASINSKCKYVHMHMHTCAHAHVTWQCKHMHLRKCEPAHLCSLLLLRRLLLDSCNHTLLRMYICTYTTDDIPHYVHLEPETGIAPSIFVCGCTAVMLQAHAPLIPPHFNTPQFATHPPPPPDSLSSLLTLTFTPHPSLHS